jgi:hypothetical protein
VPAEYLEWSEAQFAATHNADSAALDRRPREILASGGPPDFVEVEFKRVMRVVFAV